MTRWQGSDQNRSLLLGPLSVFRAPKAIVKKLRSVCLQLQECWIEIPIFDFYSVCFFSSAFSAFWKSFLLFMLFLLLKNPTKPDSEVLKYGHSELHSLHGAKMSSAHFCFFCYLRALQHYPYVLFEFTVRALTTIPYECCNSSYYVAPLDLTGNSFSTRASLNSSNVRGYEGQ